MARVETALALAEEAIKNNESLKAKVTELEAKVTNLVAKVADLEKGKMLVEDELNRVQQVTVDWWNQVASLEKELKNAKDELQREKDDHQQTEGSLVSRVLLYGERLHTLYAKEHPQFRLTRPELDDVPNNEEAGEFINSEDPDGLLMNWADGIKSVDDEVIVELHNNESDPIYPPLAENPDANPSANPPEAELAGRISTIINTTAP